MISLFHVKILELKPSILQTTKNQSYNNHYFVISINLIIVLRLNYLLMSASHVQHEQTACPFSL